MERTPHETRKRSNSSSSVTRDSNYNIYSNVITSSDGNLRKGKWSTEEELFANKIISYFNKGLLPNVAAGTTLRSYLSDKLQCDPMRITKKFAGASCIGKQVFQPQTVFQNTSMLKTAENELNQLEKEFHARLGNRMTSHTAIRSTVNTRKLNKAKELNNNNNDDDSSSPNSRDESDEDGYNDDDEFEDLGYEKVKLFRGPNDKDNNSNRIRRVISAPDITIYNEISNIPFRSLDKVFGESDYDKIESNNYSTFKRRNRSQSAMNLREFERFIADDEAAGSLLMDFYEKMQHNYKSIVDNLEDKTDKSWSRYHIKSQYFIVIIIFIILLVREASWQI